MKKLLTSLLCVMMVVCFMPAMAWADGDGETEPSTPETIEVTAEKDLSTALTEANAGDTIKLTVDVQVNAQITISKGIILDGDNHTITVTHSSTDSSSSAGILVTANDVTIQNVKVVGPNTSGTNGGTWQWKEGQYVIKVYNADDVTISDVDLSCGSGAIQVNSASVTIAGKINMHDNMYDGIEVTTGKDLTKKGELTLDAAVSFTNEESRIWMDSKDKGTVTSSGQIAQTVNPTKTSEYLYLTKEPAVQVGDNYYLTLNDAVHYASDNTSKELVLLKDTAITDTLTLNDNFTIDGNGHSITQADDADGKNIVIANGKTLTLKDVTVTGFNNNGATLVTFNKVSNMVIDGTVNFEDNTATTVLASGTDAANNVTVNGTLNISKNNADGMNGGTLTVGENGEVVANGNKRHGITAKVVSSSNGKITAMDNGYNGLTLNGGTNIAGSTVVTAKNNDNRTTNTESLKDKDGNTVPCSDIAINTNTVIDSLKSVDIGGNASVTAGTMNGYYHSSNAAVTNRDKVVNVNGSGAVVTVENPSNGEDENEHENDTNKLFVQNAEDSVAAVDNTRFNGVVILGAEGIIYGTVSGTIDLPADVTVTVADGSDASGATLNAPAGTTVKNESGSAVKVSTPNGTYTVKAGDQIESKPYNPPYVPTTPTTPTAQKPVIEPNADVTTSLSTDGTTLTIKAKDGYEITDVTVNGVSKGVVTTLTGLKTGDKIVVTTKKTEEPPVVDDSARIKAGVQATTLKIYSKSLNTEGSGKGWIQVRWVKSKGFKVDGYELYRGKTKSTMKKYDTTTKTTYTNKNYLKKGSRYYYKVRGYRMINGEKVYTQWSKTIYRLAK